MDDSELWAQAAFDDKMAKERATNAELSALRDEVKRLRDALNGWRLAYQDYAHIPPQHVVAGLYNETVRALAAPESRPAAVTAEPERRGICDFCGTETEVDDIGGRTGAGLVGCKGGCATPRGDKPDAK